jgi:hypothetical protein
MAINLSDSIRVATTKPTDDRYFNVLVPYATEQEAYDGTIGVRHIGLTVNINNKEYWFKDGTGDTDLVLKVTSSAAETTASNTGASGVGVYKSKTGSNLNFKNIKSSDASISVTDVAATSEIDLKASNLQKTIKSAELVGHTYLVTDADNGYTIFAETGTLGLIINLGTIGIANFCVGFIHKGGQDILFNGVTNPVGLKSKGAGYQTFIEREGTTANFYLLGNTKTHL